MALSMHRTEVEELIRERVAPFVLGKDILQRKREFSQPGGFRPGALALVVFRQFDIGEETTPALCALFETGDELVGERLVQYVKLIGS